MNYKYSQSYNIYYGTIGKTLGVKYRFTKNFRNSEEALKCAEKAATSFYYKNEGKLGLPSYTQISEEAKLTGVSIEVLYKDHILDMCRWYAIPTSCDHIPEKKLKY